MFEWAYQKYFEIVFFIENKIRKNINENAMPIVYIFKSRTSIYRSIDIEISVFWSRFNWNKRNKSTAQQSNGTALYSMEKWNRLKWVKSCTKSVILKIKIHKKLQKKKQKQSLIKTMNTLKYKAQDYWNPVIYYKNTDTTFNSIYYSI